MTNHAADTEFAERLTRTLARMPARRRTIFLLSCVEQKTHAEIAKAYGISEQRVRRHIGKAIGDLRRRTRPQDFRFWERWWPF